MNFKLFSTVFVILFLFLIAFGPGLEVSFSSVQADLELSLGQPAAQRAVQETASMGALETAPVMFIENVGQFDERARFQVRGDDRTIWLAEDAIWVTILEPTERPTGEARLTQGPDIGTEAERVVVEEKARHGVAIRLSFAGANSESELQAYRPQTTTVSYFIGDDPDEWHPTVPVWGGVRYVDLYPGLDLELDAAVHGVAGRLVCHAVNCQAALAAVQLEVEGADSLALEGDRLHIKAGAGTYTLPLLQAVNAGGHPLQLEEGRTTTKGNIVSMPLVEDGQQPAGRGSGLPTAPAESLSSLLYSTFLGGSGGDWGNAVALDADGNATVTGLTTSTDFPTTPGAFDTGFNGGDYDVFITKINAAGSALLYSTFLGGGDYDNSRDLAIDAAGNATVTGRTASTDFPITPGVYDTSHNGGEDVFVAKINVVGNDLLYSTFLGGSSFELGSALVLDSAGNATVTGDTWSTDFPTTPGAYDTIHDGDNDVFVARLDVAGSALLYSTFLGGWDFDYGDALASDAAGNATVIGTTTSPNFPTTPGAFDTGNNGGSDAFIAKFNADGSALLYSTFLGGSQSEWGYALALDAAGNATITGGTWSTNFPTTPGVYDTSHNGSTDVFVTKLNAAGSDLLYSTFLGGSGSDDVSDLALDADGNAAVMGSTHSTDFPTTPGAFDTDYNGGFIGDVFVSKINAAGIELLYSTFLGGGYSERSGGLALDTDGNATVTGNTGSTDFPTTPGAYDTSYNGGDDANGDAFVTRLNVRIGTYRLFIPAVMN
jgi:hypothetical protein